MDRRAGTSLLVLIISVILLALAGPVSAGMKATFSAGMGVDDTAVLRRLMTTTKLEDGVAPELTVDVELYRRVLAGGSNLASGVLKPDGASCQPSCPARGKPYTGRGCLAIYGCNPHG